MLLGKWCSKGEGAKFSSSSNILKTLKKTQTNKTNYMLRQLSNSTSHILPQNILTTLLIPIKLLSWREGYSLTEQTLQDWSSRDSSIDTSFLVGSWLSSCWNFYLDIISIFFYRLRLLGDINILLHQIRWTLLDLFFKSDECKSSS